MNTASLSHQACSFPLQLFALRLQDFPFSFSDKQAGSKYAQKTWKIELTTFFQVQRKKWNISVESGQKINNFVGQLRNSLPSIKSKKAQMAVGKERLNPPFSLKYWGRVGSKPLCGRVSKKGQDVE